MGPTDAATTAPDGGTPGQGASDGAADATAVDARLAEGGESSSDTGADDSADSGLGSSKTGDPCVASTECASTYCGPGGWCTAPCTTDAICGTSTAGAPNGCTGASEADAGTCAPACSADADCAAFAGSQVAVCVVGDGAAPSGVCVALGSDAGGTRTPSFIGDPCSADGDCLSGDCNGSWCTVACASAADSNCGVSSLQAPNACVETPGGAFLCFTTCGSNADCAQLAGTTCQPRGAANVCAPATGAVGDPCTATSSAWAPCAGVDAGAPGVCGASGWCTAPCAGDSDCGQNSASQANLCVASDAGASCAPACVQPGDCAPYLDTFCLPVPGEATSACAPSPGRIGDPCTTDDDCQQGTCGDQGSCTIPCAGASDTRCGTNSQGTVNACAVSPLTSGYECLPRCQSNADCIPFAGSCQPAAVGSVCVYPYTGSGP